MIVTEISYYQNFCRRIKLLNGTLLSLILKFRRITFRNNPFFRSENVFFFPVRIFPLPPQASSFKYPTTKLRLDNCRYLLKKKGRSFLPLFRTFISKEKQFSCGLPISNVCIILFSETHRKLNWEKVFKVFFLCFLQVEWSPPVHSTDLVKVLSNGTLVFHPFAVEKYRHEIHASVYR